MRLSHVGIVNARRQSRNGPSLPGAMCLSNVEAAYGVPHWYASAALAWKGASKKHSVRNYKDIPTGVPCYWSGGSEGYGHIAISHRRGSSKVWSTDIKRWGFFDLVDIREIEKQWGLKFEGWSAELAGVTIYTPPLKPTRVSKAMDSVHLALDYLSDAILKSHRRHRVKEFRNNLAQALSDAKEDHLER